MIVIDTNIISEMMKPSPAEKVMVWIENQVVTDLFITSITIAEIFYGLNVLPQGNRRDLLKSAFDKVISDAFKYRILFFDDIVARLYGKIMGQRKAIGRPLSILDGQIAAIALMHGAAIATRNTRDFSDCGLHLINPFEEGQFPLG